MSTNVKVRGSIDRYGMRRVSSCGLSPGPRVAGRTCDMSWQPDSPASTCSLSAVSGESARSHGPRSTVHAPRAARLWHHRGALAPAGGICSEGWRGERRSCRSGPTMLRPSLVRWPPGQRLTSSVHHYMPSVLRQNCGSATDPAVGARFGPVQPLVEGGAASYVRSLRRLRRRESMVDWREHG